jgi:two-component system, chemotaxis family, response regulator PixG
MISQQSTQNLHPLSLLAQLISRNASGCLQVVSASTAWLIYLDHGKLVYAAQSTESFKRLTRHLRQFNPPVATLNDAVIKQVRSLFAGEFSQEPWCESTSAIAPPLTLSADYQAILWLVEHQYLTAEQVKTLIEAIAKEVIESLLVVNQGSYTVIEQHELADYPNLCHLDLRAIVEHCHHQLRRQQLRQQSPASQLSAPGKSLGVERTTALSHNSALAPPRRAEFRSTNGNSPIANKTTKPYTIACIDDSPTILQSINAFLEDSEFSVLMINDPVKALMQVVRSQPDVILLDIEMPNLDGYELCALLRRHPHFKQTPIVMVTGNTGFVDRAKAKLVRASGYLTKPFTQADLLKMVFKQLHP